MLKLVEGPASEPLRQPVEAIGLATMKLRGAITRLNAALQVNDRRAIVTERTGLRAALDTYLRAAQVPSASPDANTLWLAIGETEVIVARTTLKIADARLLSSLKAG